MLRELIKYFKYRKLYTGYKDRFGKKEHIPFARIVTEEPEDWEVSGMEVIT